MPWISRRAACSAAAADALPDSNQTGSIAWRGCWPWPRESGRWRRASRWLRRSNRALGGVAPLAAIDTELGARQVENLLGRIAYGGIS